MAGSQLNTGIHRPNSTGQGPSGLVRSGPWINKNLRKLRLISDQDQQKIKNLGSTRTKVNKKFENVGPNKDQQIFENQVVRGSLTEHVHFDKVTRFTMTIIPTTNPALFSMNSTFQKLLN